MSDTIFAWTAPGSHYPAYVNFSLDGDDIVVTVRPKPSGDKCGEATSVRVPLDAWKEFLRKRDE